MYSLPQIIVPAGMHSTFNDNRGKSCLVTLKVKYKLEKDWMYHRIWMIPGWESTDIWKMAYKWIKKNSEDIFYAISEVEEAQFHNFKLV